MGRIDRCDASVLSIMRADALRTVAKREVRHVAPRIHLCRFPQLGAGGGVLHLGQMAGDRIDVLRRKAGRIGQRLRRDQAS